MLALLFLIIFYSTFPGYARNSLSYILSVTYFKFRCVQKFFPWRWPIFWVETGRNYKYTSICHSKIFIFSSQNSET